MKKPLTDSVLRRHITGRERIGIYLLRKDGRIGALAVDIDNDNLYAVMEYCGRCEHYGLVTWVERSKSKGYHLWWFFHNIVPAWKARLVARYILYECGFPKDVEVFPKQDYLNSGRFGSYVNLPLFGRDVERGRTVFLDPEAGYEPYENQWLFLSAVTKISEAKLDEIIDLNDLDLDMKTASQASIAEGAETTDYKGVGLPCFSRMLREGAEVGMRNEAALRLSVNLHRNGVPADLAVVMMREWNMRNRPPLEKAELERTVCNGYSGRYSYGCLSPLIQRYCDPRCPVFRKYSRKRGSEVSSDSRRHNGG